MKKISSFLRWVSKSKRHLAILIAIILVLGFSGYRIISSKTATTQYQTAQAQKGNLVESISASGQITSANNVSITIQASGIVKEVLVKNGDTVTQGQTIATLTLDQASQQKSAAAYASYLSAQSSLSSAQAKLNSLQSAEFTANQKFINDAVARNLKTDDPTYIEENANWLQAEADYKNQQTVIDAANSSLSAASLTLSQVSGTISSPASGIVKGLTITPGAVVATAGSSAATLTSQVLGSVYQDGPIQAEINISEVDSVNVEKGQKVTMTLDAFPNATFTGKIVSINTNGIVSSGVTTYPAIISFDSGNDHIYPNMAVTATIITKIKNDVVLVPSSAVQTNNSGSTVRIIKNGKIISIPVKTGDSNDTQTEITSGIKAGNIVVTGTAANAASAAASVFSTGFPGAGLRPGGLGGGGRTGGR